jgi:glyceraldehyde-3-phosphate dehydrogenase/erythrose-4-phosphate dehydrogenase
MTRIAINGFCRIGRNVMRAAKAPALPTSTSSR